MPHEFLIGNHTNPQSSGDRQPDRLSAADGNRSLGSRRDRAVAGPNDENQ